jgi:hypothetical protein
MAVDFSAMLKKQSGKAKRPKALPRATYPGKIKAWEVGDKNTNNTPYVRFHVVPTSWPDSVDEADRMQEGAEEGSLVPINLSKRQLRRDIFTAGTDGSDMMWRLDEFLKSLGLEMGPSYEELLPQVIGKDVLIDVTQYVNQRSGELENQVDRIVGIQE